MPGLGVSYTETNKKNFDYEKTTWTIYGNMLGGDARFAVV